MKKALSFAVALGLVAGMASTAAATDINGTMRVRGVRATNMTDGSDVGQDKEYRYDTRTRFMTKSMVADNVTAETRMTLLSENLGDNTAGTDVSAGNTVNLDRAWITVKDQPITGGTWAYGRMPADWSKFFSWGGTADRIKATYSLGGGNKIGGFIQKSTELDVGTADGDSDGYTLFYVGSAGDTKYKVIIIRAETDQGGTGPETAGNGASVGDDLVGHYGDVNVVAKAGPATIEADLVYKGGDMFDGDTDDAQVGLQATAKMASGALNLTGVFAYSMDGMKADDDYTPTLLIGDSQVTAFIDFGESQTKTVAQNGDSAMLLAVGASTKVNDAMTLGGAIAYYQMTEFGYLASSPDANGDSSMTEIDLRMDYAIAKNTSFTAGLAYGMVDNWSTADDDILTLGWWIQTKW